MLSPERLQGRGECGRLNAEAVFAPQGFWEASVYGHRRRGRTRVTSAYPLFRPGGELLLSISTQLEALSVCLGLSSCPRCGVPGIRALYSLIRVWVSSSFCTVSS